MLVDARRAAVIDAWATHSPRGVLFDFNGTLSDDEPLLFAVYREMFRTHLRWTLSPRHYAARLVGRSDREIVELLVAELAEDDEVLTARLMQERRERYRDLAERESPIREATVELVQTLHKEGVALGIVTGAQRADVDFVLSRSPLDGLFAVIVTEEDVAAGKPQPDGFLAGAHGLGLAPPQIVAVEDSLHGVRAARAAGLACIAVAGTHDRAVLAVEADAVVDQLSPALLSR